MTDLQFGFMLMIFGMGLVFLILAMLWLIIALFQWLDRHVLATVQEDETAQVTAHPATLSPDLLAAIIIAIDRYRQPRKPTIHGQRIPKRLEPGQARWAAVGRSYQLGSQPVLRRRVKK